MELAIIDDYEVADTPAEERHDGPWGLNSGPQQKSTMMAMGTQQRESQYFGFPVTLLENLLCFFLPS